VTSPVTTTAIPADQLDSLVAPIALYPDPLLAQTLAASTYPLEIMQLQQFLQKHPTLTGQALAHAVAKQPWDPSVQAMAAFPDVVKRLAENVQWTSDLGNAVVSQESAVMDAVQRMRVKAESNGQLQSTPQQVVETRVIDDKSVVVIEPASPETVYVPSYNPVAVYGAPVYPYPSMYYPSYYPSAGAYAAGAAISFGLGVAAGAFWGNGGWGWNAGWGRGDINVNRNNYFARNSNLTGYRGANLNNTWRHNAANRGGVGYRNQAAAAARSRGGAVGTAGRAGAINRGAVGTTGMTGAQRGNFSGQRGNYSGQRGNYSGQRGNYSGQRGNLSGANRGNFSGANRGNYSANRGNFSGANRGNFSGANRGSFSGANRGSFSGSRGSRGGFSGGGRRGGGGGRRGGGGGRRGGGGGRR
jgi:hypothetical protein